MGLFYSGKIYATTYSNWKHDSLPLIWVLYSDSYKTHGINLHYFPQPLLHQFILFIKKFSQRFDANLEPNLGRILYRIIKKYYPHWAKQSYRTYFTNMLNGHLVNEGITAPVQNIINPTPSKSKEDKDLMARMLNKNLGKKTYLSDVKSWLISKMPAPPEPTNYLGMK